MDRFNSELSNRPIVARSEERHSMNTQEELQSLQELHQAGGMSDADFEARKAELLNPQPAQFAQPTYAVMDQQTRQWAMVLHLSQFAGYAVPLAGLIAPIVIWQVKKNELPGIDAHGKIIM